MLAAELIEPRPARALVSGFGPGEAPAVLEAYARGGLRESRRVDANGWVVALLQKRRLERDLCARRVLRHTSGAARPRGPN